MKKIGIITFHCADNFGAVLQAYGLREYIKSLGCDVDIINYIPSSIRNPYKLIPDNNTVKRYMQSGLKYTLKNLVWDRIKTGRQRIKKIQAFNHFRKQKLGITSKKYEENASLNGTSYDLYITGSDQVWNPDCTNGVDDNYYLNFVDSSRKKISYAASIGKDDVNEYLQEIKTFLKDFNAISVREYSAKKIIEPLCDHSVEVVLDPVFLLSKTTWDALIPQERCYPEKFIFFYCIDNNPKAIKMANRLSEKFHLPIVHFYFGALRKKIVNDGKCFYFEGPLDFLWYIKHAEYIVTSSFHCVAFSIIFEKDFLPYLYAGRASRVKDLLTMLKLDARINYEPNLVDSGEIEQKIDYMSVKNLLKSEKAKSENYIKKILEYGGEEDD